VRLSHLSTALACFAAAIVFATVAAASTPLISWMDEPVDGVALPQVLASPTLREREHRTGTGRRSPCDSCGVVESVRLLERVGNLPASYEVNVRLRDGSLRTSNIANPARWRAGDRIMLIGGIQSAGL
jgi:hypothetical protein